MIALIVYLKTIKNAKNGPVSMNRNSLVFLCVAKILSREVLRILFCLSNLFSAISSTAISSFSSNSSGSFFRFVFLTLELLYFLAPIMFDSMF